MDEKLAIQYIKNIKDKITMGNFKVAIEFSNQLISKFPNLADGYYYKGVCFFALEKYDTAIRLYVNALKLNPGFAKAYFNLGVCYYMLENKDSALINIGKALIIFSKIKDGEKRQRCVDAIQYLKGSI